MNAYESAESKSAKNRWELNVSSFLSKITPKYSLDEQYKAWTVAQSGVLRITQDKSYWQKNYNDELVRRITVLLSAKDQLDQFSI